MDHQREPVREITPKQLVAYNMGRWRRVNGMTQEQLGEELGGWTTKAVSAAERSWDGRRVREFDADLIVRLAVIFGVPVQAMFLLPPDGSGYTVNTGGGSVTAGEFFVSLMAESGTGSRTAARKAYAEELVSAVAAYTEPGTHEAVTRTLQRDASEEQLSSALQRALRGSGMLGSFQDAIGAMRLDNELLREFLITTLRETPSGRERLAAMDREQRLTEWHGQTAAWCQAQSRLAGIGRELFGERGASTREEIDEVSAEARSRGLKVFVPWIRQRLADGDWEIIDLGGDAKGMS